MKKRKDWTLTRDPFGMCNGIAYKRWTILHLNPGTCKNVEYARRFVNILNLRRFKITVDKIAERRNHGKRA